MGKAEGSFPSVHDATTLWQWVKEINKTTGSDLRATAHIMGTAWKRVQKICYTLKLYAMDDSKQHFQEGLDNHCQLQLCEDAKEKEN